MKKWLLELISDDQGHPSSMRLFLLMFGVIVIGAWLYNVITTAWVDPPWQTVGVLAGGKAVQKIGERY